VKVAEEALGARVTEEGMVNWDEALLASRTVALVMVGFDKETVQVVLALGNRVAAAHCSEEIVGRVARVSVAVWDEPFRLAVRVAVRSAVKAVAVARNVPVTEPQGIVSEVGTMRSAELEFRPTVPPPDPLRITVQVLEALGAEVPGMHVMELIKLTILTVPPVPVMATASPVSEAPKLLLMVIGTTLLPDRVTDRTAITPSEMILEFNPHARHL
jgi:hypothetical protein